MREFHCFIFLIMLMGLLITEMHLNIIRKRYLKEWDISSSVHLNKKAHPIVTYKENKASQELPNDTQMEVESTLNRNGGINSLNNRLYKLDPVKPEKENEPPWILSQNNRFPVGYELIRGVGYYKFYAEGAKTYQEAVNRCIKDGAHLAVLNSKKEAVALRGLYARYPNVQRYAYIGFNDLKQEGKYVTIFGQPLASAGYAEWDSGEPNNYDDSEDCGSITRRGTLNDLVCGTFGPWPFICEFESY